MTMEEIESKDAIDCEICGYEIMDRCILLSTTERFVLGIVDEPKSGDTLVMCERCFEDRLYNFKICHGTDSFKYCKNTVFDERILVY